MTKATRTVNDDITVAAAAVRRRREIRNAQITMTAVVCWQLPRMLLLLLVRFERQPTCLVVCILYNV
jgi:hypothetical protein